MKKILLALFILTTIQSKAQITFEHTYIVPEGKQFWFTDLGNNNYKYFIIDYYGNSFSLYNLDHTPYMLNIVPGVPLDSNKYYIAYITSSLFDCDTSNIEYVETPILGHPEFYVFRTDGTLIFSKDSTYGPYCVGCFNGTKWIQPVFNTPEGTKMGLVNAYTSDWSIYSLCGTLPETINEPELGNQYVQIHPNPSSGSTVFEVNAPSNIEDYEFAIYNSLMQVVKTERLQGSKTVTINNENLTNGNYFFSLQTKNKIVQTGKFIITK